MHTEPYFYTTPTFMTQRELVKKLASELNIPQKAAKEYLDTFSSIVTETVAAGEDVMLSIGSFKKKKREAHVGFNPKTKEKMQIAERHVPVFRPTERFKKAVAG